jgi:hypothetical protein
LGSNRRLEKYKKISNYESLSSSKKVKILETALRTLLKMMEE